MRDSIASTYNLIEENWIPCIMTDGTLVHMGLLDVFLHAQNISEVSHHSPLVVGSLHRLFFAILQRSMGHLTIDDIGELFDNDTFDVSKVRTYLEKWKDRFYLYDEEQPFFPMSRF